MNAREILRGRNIEPEDSLFMLTKEEALETLLEAVTEFCPEVSVEDCSKEEIEQLFINYGESIILYHPEGFHQERAALFKSYDVLKNHGMTSDDLETLDFT